MAKNKVLAYHSIGTPTAEVGAELYCVSLEQFREQMEYLLSKMGTVLFGDSPHFTITFDDGDITNCTNALPILKEFGLKAYFFIIGSKINSFGYMGWDEIRELKDAGMIIGSHGMTHRILTELNDDELDYELSVSKELLEHNLDTSVDSFSIPRGFSNTKVIQKAKETGYKTIFASNDRIAVKASWDTSRFVRAVNGRSTFGEQAAASVLSVSKRLLGAKAYDGIRMRLLRRPSASSQ